MSQPAWPRHVVIDNFLPEKDAGDLLGFALANEALFEPASVIRNGQFQTDDHDRRAWSCEEMGAARGIFTAAVEAHVEHLCKALSIAPFTIAAWDVGFAAHRDGDYFHNHIDTVTAENRDTLPGDRLLSLVYYLHRPKARFEGGDLILNHFSGDAEPGRIAPKHNRLVAFPSIIPHAVEQVRIPGNAWEDARFSINCWLLRARN